MVVVRKLKNDKLKKIIIILILSTTGLFSCKQGNKSTPDYNDKDIYTKYEYTDSSGASLIIQNSFPKGGVKYTDSKGKIYIYAIFWTRIINNTDNPLELKINFPVNSYEVPSLPGKYFKILVPPDTMTLDKISLVYYGLTDLKSFLDSTIQKSSSLKRAINPKESSGFYVVMLCLVEEAHGVVRTGLSIKGQNLFYRIQNLSYRNDDKEIHCGSINLKNLILQK